MKDDFRLRMHTEKSFAFNPRLSAFIGGHRFGRLFNILKNVELQIDWRTAPFLGIYIGDGLRKSPKMSGQVFDIVLPFAIRKVGRRSHYPSSVLAGALVVAIDVIHTHHHCVRLVPARLSLFGENDSAIANIQLRAVICNSNTQRKTERVAKPVDGLAYMRIRKLGDHCTPRNRAVRKHSCLLSLSPLYSSCSAYVYAHNQVRPVGVLEY